MHGSYGVGPGQKKSAVIDDFVSSSPISAEEAAGEALNNSFGVGSYARRILEGMGWKEVNLSFCLQGYMFPIIYLVFNLPQ